MHRCYGISTDINAEATRAVTKMKAAITQRFMIDGCDVDAESDCRFCFFWVKTESGAWCAKYVRHWYEKVRICYFHSAPYTILTTVGQTYSGKSQQGTGFGRGPSQQVSQWVSVLGILSRKNNAR